MDIVTASPWQRWHVFAAGAWAMAVFAARRALCYPGLTAYGHRQIDQADGTTSVILGLDVPAARL